MEKIKSFLESDRGKVILTVIIIVLVGTGSFELGRLSKGAHSSSGIKIEYPKGEQQQAQGSLDQSANALSATESLNNIAPKIPTSNTTSSSKFFFASKRGHKYYPVGCSAGKSLKQENRIYFSTAAEAEKAGYALSSSCK